MKSKFIVFITILLSLLGCALQCWCQAAAYEPANGLPISGSPALWALCVYAVAVPVLALLLSLPLRGLRPQGEASFYQNMGAPGCAVGVTAGALFLLGGAVRLAGGASSLLFTRNTGGLASCAVDLLLAVGGGAMIWMSLSAKKPSFRVHHSLWALLPGFSGCFWLVIYYHSHSRDAVVLHYCWILLCLMASILAFYYQAGFAFDRARPLRAQWCSIAAAVYAFTALPDSASLSDALLLLGLGLWMLLHCALIPRRSEVHGHREQL